MYSAYKRVDTFPKNRKLHAAKRVAWELSNEEAKKPFQKEWVNLVFITPSLSLSLSVCLFLSLSLSLSLSTCN